MKTRYKLTYFQRNKKLSKMYQFTKIHTKRKDIKFYNTNFIF